MPKYPNQNDNHAGNNSLKKLGQRIGADVQRRDQARITHQETIRESQAARKGQG
jgi:hypothetical protein